jgi:hypothetical protein
MRMQVAQVRKPSQLRLPPKGQIQTLRKCSRDGFVREVG